MKRLGTSTIGYWHYLSIVYFRCCRRSPLSLQRHRDTAATFSPCNDGYSDWSEPVAAPLIRGSTRRGSTQQTLVSLWVPAPARARWYALWPGVGTLLGRLSWADKSEEADGPPQATCLGRSRAPTQSFSGAEGPKIPKAREIGCGVPNVFTIPDRVWWRRYNGRLTHAHPLLWIRIRHVLPNASR